MGAFGVSAKRDDRRVLKQQEHVSNAAFFAQLDQALLQTQAGCVIESSELDN